MQANASRLRGLCGKGGGGWVFQLQRSAADGLTNKYIQFHYFFSSITELLLFGYCWCRRLKAGGISFSTANHRKASVCVFVLCFFALNRCHVSTLLLWGRAAVVLCISQASSHLTHCKWHLMYFAPYIHCIYGRETTWEAICQHNVSGKTTSPDI